MKPSIDHLAKAKIRQLLAAVGSRSPAPRQDQAIRNVMEYDWRDPHYLNCDQLNRLAAGMSQVAVRLGGIFTRFFGREFDVSPTAITQHFANDLCRSLEFDRTYYQTFGPEKGSPCGILAIPSPTALAWVTRLLGDSDPGGDPDRALSSLEESLLADLAAAVLETFLASLQPHENLKGDGVPSKGQPIIQFEFVEAMCRIVFQVKESGQNDRSDLVFLLPCDRLVALAGKAPTTMLRTAPQELSRMLMEHLQQMPVTVTARLASTRIRFQEVLDLAPGDVLLLNKPIHEMVELVVEDRTAFRGYAAQSWGRYALVVRESATGQTQEALAPKTSGEPRKG